MNERIVGEVADEIRQYNVYKPKLVEPARIEPLPEAKPAAVAEKIDEAKAAVMTGVGLLQVADSAMSTVMEAVEEAEARVKRLRDQAEHCIKHLRAWSNEFASQHMQLLEQCTTLELTINEAVNAIKTIGTKPVSPADIDVQK